MKYPAYPDYTATGPNGASFPASWPVQRLRFHIQSNPVRSEVAHLAPETLVTFVPMEAVGEWGGMDTSAEREVGDVSNGYTYFANGDVVMAKITPCFENGKGAIAQGLSNGVGFGTTELHVIRPNESLSNRWVFYLTMSHLFRKRGEAEMFGAGGQKRVPEDFIRNLRVGIPSLDEQERIADFLDWRTAQIDALIAKKQSLLERLTEKRVNVIASSVTNGLVRQVEVRPSGAAWFAQVPKHWQVKRIKFIGTVGNGSTPARDDSSYWNEGNFPWLNSSVANQEAVTEAEQFVTPLALKECHLPIIEPPAVLVGITGQGKTRGMATTLMIRATINQHLAYIKPVETECEVRFLRRVFDAAYAYLRNESDGGGSTKGAITCEQIAELPIPLPPLKEQQAIADHIDKVLDRINRIADKATTAIERLTEYRSALITAAVTGQIDVRGVQVPAPG